MTRLLKPLWQPLFAACCALGVASPVSALTIAIDDSNLANYFTDSASTTVFPCPANIAGPGTLCLADPGLPAAANPTVFLHAVEHGVKRSEGETQGTFGLFLDAPGNFIPMQSPWLEDAKYGKFRRAPLDACADHRGLPYV